MVSNRLTILNVSSIHEGAYSARLSNDVGSITSNSVEVTVNIPPAIEVNSTSVLIDPFGYAEFDVRSLTGHPYPTVTCKHINNDESTHPVFDGDSMKISLDDGKELHVTSLSRNTFRTNVTIFVHLNLDFRS